MRWESGFRIRAFRRSDDMSDYAKDMEVVWEEERLKELIINARDRVSAHEELLTWLESHPDFKMFWNLLKRSERY